MGSFAPGGAFDVELLDVREGFIVFKVSGKEVDRIFAHESGGHRFQRVPKTEKRGRVQTSTITVVILEDLKPHQITLKDSELEWSICRSGGSGGQGVNKTNTAVQVKHKPTGLTVRVESRSQHQNKQDALAILQGKLNRDAKERAYQERASERKQQAGTGMRGDKIRTIRVQDGIVSDHQLDKKISYRDYVKGKWDDLLGF